MHGYLKKKKEKFFAFLKRKKLFKTAAFIQSLPELFVAIGTGYGAHTIGTVTVMDEINKVLRSVLFVLVSVWWLVRFYDNYQKTRKPKKTRI